MTAQSPGVEVPGIRGARFVELPVYRDERGALTFAQEPDQLPFQPVRFFLLFDLALGHSRGAHAHKELEQYLVCVHGQCRVDLDDGQGTSTLTLDRAGAAVYVPRMVWTTVTPEGEGTVVLVMTSHRYDVADYIRDYDEFRRAVTSRS